MIIGTRVIQVASQSHISLGKEDCVWWSAGDQKVWPDVQLFSLKEPRTLDVTKKKKSSVCPQALTDKFNNIPVKSFSTLLKAVCYRTVQLDTLYLFYTFNFMFMFYVHPLLNNVLLRLPLLHLSARLAVIHVLQLQCEGQNVLLKDPSASVQTHRLTNPHLTAQLTTDRKFCSAR